jgi:TRAP-type mannitol/chloroaromatic compound transport system substrate-binding protein
MRVRHFVPHRLRVVATARLLGSLACSVAAPTAAVAQTKTHTWKLQSTWPQANLFTDSVAALVKSIDEMC